VAVHLTSSEVKLLDILSRKNGGVVTRHALSTEIGAKSERAVDIQIIRLRQKIENNPSIPEHLVTVRGIGYRLVVESP
jgi:two-component system phosphate regulon response regulator OmpR